MNGSDKVWYACYGSNLKAERFRCYIKGGYCPCNGKYYKGCRNKTLWTDFKIKRFPGKLYFANVSESWGDTGVAYYDPDGEGTVIMRLYKITCEQLLDVQKQEGRGDTWYGNLLPLGTDEDGTPVYTMTCETKSASNRPGKKYLSVIREALIEECEIKPAEAEAYLEQALRNQP